MTNAFVCPRYEDDVYDRLWRSRSTLSNWVPINTSSVINTRDRNDSYQPPAQVLRTAVQPPSGHNALTYVRSYGTNSPYNATTESGLPPIVNAINYIRISKNSYILIS